MLIRIFPIIIFNLLFVSSNYLSAQETNKSYEIKIDSSQLILGNIIDLEIYTEFNDIIIEPNKSKSFKFIGIKVDSTRATSKIKYSSKPNSNRYIKIARFEIKETGELSFPPIKVITSTAIFETNEEKIKILSIENYIKKNKKLPFINNEKHPLIKGNFLSEFILTNNNYNDTLFLSVRVYCRFSNPIMPYAIEKSEEFNLIKIDKKGISNGLITKEGKLFQSYDIFFFKKIPENLKKYKLENLNLHTIIKIPFEKLNGLFGVSYRDYKEKKILTKKSTY
tara:strand:+ start:2842 stop:3681 length:840 start_codon:yes stop_codon:yes gene_type:complete